MNGALDETYAEEPRGPGRTRMCALTRNVRPESELVRFVAGPDGNVVADIKARLPGRGVWVGLERGAVAEAARKNVFARALKSAVKPPPNLPEEVGLRLREAALGRLGLARKAGAVLSGFAKVQIAVEREQLAGVLIAADAAPDGLRKMEQALYRRFGDRPEMPVVRLFSAEQLGLAIGRPNVIHAAVLQAPAGRSFVDAVIRLQRYEGVGDGQVNESAGEAQGETDE